MFIKNTTVDRGIWRPVASCRGTASVEAVIVLPVLIVLLAGVMYVSRSVSALHEAESIARSCAWRFSAMGCGNADSLGGSYPECKDFVSAITPDADIAGAAENGVKKAVPKSVGDLYTDASAGIDSLLKPVLDTVLGAIVRSQFQREARATVIRSTPRVGLAFDQGQRVQATFQVPCNLVSTTPVTVVRNVFTENVVKPLKEALGL